jgi:hypothetical protein
VEVHSEADPLGRDETGIVIGGGIRDPAALPESPQVRSIEGRGLHRGDAAGDTNDRRFSGVKDKIGSLVFLGCPTIQLDGFRRVGHH